MFLIYQVYVLIQIYYFSKRNRTFELTGYFSQLLRVFSTRKKAGDRWPIVVLQMMFFLDSM